ncbi:MAG: hypothetical protein O2855_09090 [Planctomycetota bacterium]|nr:hypothetical protein [Planctomycetota bacterium]
MSAVAIDGFAILPSGELLISINTASTVAGITDGPSGTTVDDYAFAVDSNGTMTLSTVGAYSVTGASGLDEDAFVFRPSTTGTTTAGVFSIYFVAAARGIPTSSNINAVHVLP